MHIYFLCCGSYFFFVYSFVTLVLFFFFESDLQYSLFPSRLLFPFICTDKLIYQDKQRNNGNFIFILFFLPRTNTVGFFHCLIISSKMPFPYHFWLFKASALASHFSCPCHLNERGDFSGKKTSAETTVRYSGWREWGTICNVGLVFFFFSL